MDCTVIGCQSGLSIQFSSPPTAPYHVEATSPDAGARSFDCTLTTGCTPPPLQMVDYTPETVTLIVTYAGHTSATTLKPTYQVSNPNGRSCAPTCHVGTVTLPLP